MNTIPLNYKSIGEGQPIVILHGLFGSLDNWQTLARKMSEFGYKVVTVDLRNHGRSPHVPEMSHELMAEDVKAFLLEHQLQNCTLVGHSMGGKTVMQLAIKYPELIQKLIVVDIAPKPYKAHHNTYFEAMLELPVSELTSRADIQNKLSEKIKNQAVLLFIAKNLERRKDGGFQWKFNLNALYENYTALINGLNLSAGQKFEKETLFIGGQLSDYISKSDEKEIKDIFPLSRIEMIQNAGHWVHAEQPNQFLNSVLNFVKE